MATLSENIIAVNTLGRSNLAEKGVAVYEDATTYEIMESIKEIQSANELEPLIIEISNLIGSKTEGEVIWSDTVSGFAYNEEMGGYTAPYTKGLPDVEAGLYKISINGEVFDCSVIVDADDGVFVIMSQGTPKIHIVFIPSMKIVMSMTEMEAISEIKLIKSDDIVDWAIYITPKPDGNTGYIEAFFTKDVFVNTSSATDNFTYKIEDNSGNLIYEYPYDTIGFYWEDSFSRFRMYTNNIDVNEYNAIQNSIDTNKPLTFTFTQTLNSGEVIIKTASGVPVVRNDLIHYEGEDYYCWGNSDAFIMGE